MSFIAACSSESPDKLYGVYKDSNNNRDKYGYIYCFEISEKQIYSKKLGWLDVNKIQKDGNLWVIEASNFMKYKNPQILKFKIIDDNTIEYVETKDNQEKLIRTYTKITTDEYKHIQNDQLLEDYPSLF